jgi:predicted nucleotidyltransferase
MAPISTSVMQSVERFLAAAQQQARIEAAYLYGSQVGGTAMPWSDIDLALISADFSDNLFQERLVLMRLAAKIDDRIEPHPFTPERFNINDPLVSEIRRAGVQLR